MATKVEISAAEMWADRVEGDYTADQTAGEITPKLREPLAIEREAAIDEYDAALALRGLMLRSQSYRKYVIMPLPLEKGNQNG